MTDRTVLVTGSTGGIGRETARGLAKLGAQVVLVGRDAGRARTAADELKRDTGNDRIAALTADVAQQNDLRRLSDQVADRYDTLHVLINNVGMSRPRRELTADGVEYTFAANVLAPFTLTHLLLPLLRRGAAEGHGRVVNVTGGIPGGPIDLDNLQAEKSYVGWVFSQYNNAKRALMAMSCTFAQRLAGTGVTVNVAYPGHGYTPGNRSVAFPRLYRPVAPLLRVLGPVLLGERAIAKAARSSVHLASSADVAGVTGAYFNLQRRRTPWPAATTDERNREVVWALCERLSGERSPAP